jgi:hypothetical protein
MCPLSMQEARAFIFNFTKKTPEKFMLLKI